MENELYHHGILGMKWGVRRYQNKDGSLTPAGKKRYDIESKSSGKVQTKGNTSSNNITVKKKSIKDMSDSELQAAIDRAGLEKRYKEAMSAQNPRTVSKGKDFITDVLINSGKNIATQTTTWLLGTAVNKAIESFGGPQNAINPKKGQKDK